MGGYKTSNSGRTQGCTLHGGGFTQGLQHFPLAKGECGTANFHCVCKVAGDDWGPTPDSCPVKCQYDGNKIKVEHLLEHPKMDPWIGSQPGGIEPESATNKVFHRCFHRIADTTGPFGTTNGKDATSARTCQCECAQWEQETCSVTAASCPTQQCQSASTLTGTKATDCKFHSKQLRTDQCLAGDKPDESCTVECPATASNEVIQKWSNFNDGSASGCEVRSNRLQDSKNGDCKWTSSKKAVDKNTFDSFDVQFKLKGRKLERSGRWRDRAQVYIRTCHSTSDGSCGQWRTALRKDGNTINQNYQWYNINVDHSQILRNNDRFVQAKVKFHNDGSLLTRESHELDDLKITAVCE